MTTKVINIWNTCGIGGLLAKYLEMYFDYDTIAIARKSHDVFHHSNNKTLVWDNRASVWLMKCILKAKSYDIIHIHGGVQWLPYFRMIYPNKKIVLHLHGTKIRGRWDKEDVSKADLILVSTSDLLEGSPDSVLYLPNPVDEELINQINSLNNVKEKGWAFHVNRYAVDKAKEYASLHNLELNLFNRDKLFYNHYDFLSHLSEWEYYIDVKRDFPKHVYGHIILKAVSLTGLEALALGCKVINWDNKVLEGLPLEHKGENVAKRLHEIYQGLLADD